MWFAYFLNYCDRQAVFSMFPSLKADLAMTDEQLGFVGAAFMTLSGCVLWLAPRLLARAYSPDAAVIALAASLIPIAGVFQVFDGLQVVSIGVLRGVGDTRTPLIVNLIGYWGFALPLSLWFAFHLGWGPRGLWWGLVVGLMVVAIILVIRVRQRLWRTLERLIVDEGVPAVGS